ncbi:MAG TPA: TIGR04076 family protein, partial [Candidatus Marinimicrobia bacterium]|nr:TIGR04076 family protein [Candidatus Neomarinimicrobiota bacterium]
MYELKVTVKKVMGECTAEPAMKSGDYFTVSDGDIQIPEGGYICLWALQSLMPLITPKEREITEEQDEDWMWRVHHAQCPDPKGRVIFKIERTGNVDRNDREEAEHQA